VSENKKIIPLYRQGRTVKSSREIQQKLVNAKARWLATGVCNHPEEFEIDSTKIAGDLGMRRCGICEIILDPSYR